MRRYGLYDATRGLTLAVAAGLAGLLLYLASQVGQQTTGRFWAELGIVAAAGFVLALAPVLGGWTSGLVLRPSPGTFLLGFVPVLVVVGWILMASQPGHGWHEGRIVSWSHEAGLMGLVHELALWHGVLALGFGLVLGSCLDSVPAPVPATAAGDTAAAEPAGRRRRRWRGPQPVAAGRGAVAGTDGTAADEPTLAEQREAPTRTNRTMAGAGRRTDTIDE